MHTHELLHTLSTLWRHPCAGREEIRAFQNRKIRHLIRHACKNIAYYRRLFERNGIHPDDISSGRDLSLIPVTEKNDLRGSALEDLLAPGASPQRLVCRITSGSSGRPFVVRRAFLEEHVINMFRIRTDRHYGLRLRDRTALITAVNISGEKRETFLTRLRQGIGVHRFYPLNCLQAADAICRGLEEINPDIIVAYPSAVAQVAPLLQGKLPGGNLRHIVCGGESLTRLKRTAIEQGFGVPVFNILGAHECNIVAWECPETGLYHVCDDNIVADVEHDGKRVKEGERGELVITALHSYAMPFIRYRMGDVVVKGPETCPCGQPFSTFQEIKGRIRDYFLLPDGRNVHPLEVVLPFIVSNAPWLNQFQLTQETKTRFVLRVSALRQPTSRELETLRELITGRIGPGGDFRIEVVDHIPFEASGKFKDCRSLLLSDD